MTSLVYGSYMHIHYSMYMQWIILMLGKETFRRTKKQLVKNTFRTWIMTTVQKVLFICHPGAVSHQSCLSLLYVSSNVLRCNLKHKLDHCYTKTKSTLFFCNHLSRNKFPTTLHHK